MSLCGHVTELTPQQRQAASELQSTGIRLLRHLRTTYPHDIEWKMLERWWNKKVLVGTDENQALFNADTGCLLIGIPKDGGKPEILSTKLLLALSKGASSGKVCSSLHDTILHQASKRGIKFELSCSDIREYGLTSSIWAQNTTCHTKRLSWPEYIGIPVKEVKAAFERSGYRTDISTWDSMYGKPAVPDIVRIIYDPSTNLVVSPAPHLSNIPIPRIDDECFMKPDDASAIKCIGAPIWYPPAEWNQFVGKFFTEVVDTLRMQYPHATIEAIPSTAGVSHDLRQDRIRVRFDPDTARVASIPTVG